MRTSVWSNAVSDTSSAGGQRLLRLKKHDTSEQLVTEVGEETLNRYDGGYTQRMKNTCHGLRKVERTKPRRIEEVYRGIIQGRLPHLNSTSCDEYRIALLKEFFQEEDAFLSVLDTLVYDYREKFIAMSRLQVPIVEDDLIVDVFSNTVDIRNIVYFFNDRLRRSIPEVTQEGFKFSMYRSRASVYCKVLCQSILSFCNSFTCFALFATNYDRSTALVRSMRKQLQKLDGFLFAQELYDNSSFSFLMSVPIVRLIHYKVIVDLLQESYLVQKKSVPVIDKAQIAIKDVVRFCFGMSNDISARMKTAFIQERLFLGKISLVQPDRFLIYTGFLSHLPKRKALGAPKVTKPLMYVLTNNVLVVGEPEKQHYKLKSVYALYKMRVDPLDDTGNIKNAFNITIEDEGITITLIAKSPGDKKMWTFLLDSTIESLRERAVKNNIQIDTKDVVNSVKKTHSRAAIVKNAIDRWVSVETDLGIPFSFEIKSGITSLVTPSVPHESRYDLETRQVFMYKQCESKDCREQSLPTFLGQYGVFCLGHSIQRDPKDAAALESDDAKLGNADFQSEQSPSPSSLATSFSRISYASTVLVNNDKLNQTCKTELTDVFETPSESTVYIEKEKPLFMPQESQISALVFDSDSDDDNLLTRLKKRADAVKEKKEEESPFEETSVWKELYSEEYSAPYYLNKKTGHVQWTKPEEEDSCIVR